MNSYERSMQATKERRRPTGRIIRETSSPYAYTTPEEQRVIEHYEGKVTLTIDVDAIARELGRRALLSRGGKAQFMRGLIVCKRCGKPSIREEVMPLRPLAKTESYA
ncbi:MAG: hypothetical protein PHE83_16720 [Opitutaceae bacterium]|nr:hypothetical protein [Opitutaceae bacterium]